MRLIQVEILGVKLEADLLNHKVVRKYNEGLRKVAEISSEAGKCAEEPDGLEMECNAVIGFIDDIFGSGSARKVLGEETDLLTCLDAWEELVELYEKQVNPIIKERSRILVEKFGNQSGDMR